MTNKLLLLLGLTITCITAVAITLITTGNISQLSGLGPVICVVAIMTLAIALGMCAR